MLWFLVRFKSGIGGNHHILDTLRLLDLFFLNSGLEFNHCGGKICCRFIGDFWSFIRQERRRSDCFLSEILENFSHFLIVGDESYDSHLRFANRTLQRINLKILLDQPGPGRTDLSVYRVSFPPFLDLFKFCFYFLFFPLSSIGRRVDPVIVDQALIS